MRPARDGQRGEAREQGHVLEQDPLEAVPALEVIVACARMESWDPVLAGTPNADDQYKCESGNGSADAQKEKGI